MVKLIIILLFPFFSFAQPGRFAGVSIATDADAQSYMTRVEATGYTFSQVFKNGVNYFVIGEKNHLFWTELYDAGMFIGGTAAAHSETLKGVNDVTWNGTVTHDERGSVGNGTDGYGGLGFNSNVLTLHNSHISVYSPDNTAVTYADMSAVATTTSRILIYIYSAGNYVSDHNTGTTSSGRISVANANASGFYISSRISSTSYRAIRNGAQIGSTATSANLGTFPAVQMVIFGTNTSGVITNFSARKLCFWSAGDGYASVAEATTFSTLVNNLQRTLGRNTY